MEKRSTKEISFNHTGLIMQVIWDELKAKFKLTHTVQDLDFVLKNIRGGEIIGNIYENPELLEKI